MFLCDGSPTDNGNDVISSIIVSLQNATRVLNERLCVLVVARGDASVQYQLTTTTETSGKLLAAMLAVGFVVALVVAALLRIYAKRERRKL